MIGNLVPIQTHYAGCLFRSRLEARWAVFFDTLNIRWEYEPEGFEFSDGSRYLPDFYLPNEKLWVEIKPGEVPSWKTHDGSLKVVAIDPELTRPLKLARFMAEEGKQNIVILYGQPRWSDPDYLSVTQQLHYEGLSFIGNFDSDLFQKSLMLPYHVESLTEFLQGKGFDAKPFDGSLESVQALINFDRQYFRETYNTEHPTWLYGFGERGLRWYPKAPNSLIAKMSLDLYKPGWNIVNALNAASSARF